MPRELFGCEVCGDVFRTQNEAVECEERHIRRCANPACENKFVVIGKGDARCYYCPECQNAAKQRRHRERKKKAGGGGLQRVRKC